MSLLPGAAAVVSGSRMWLLIVVGVAVLLLIALALWFAFRSGGVLR